MHYTVLAGGTGAAKFLLGLIQVIPQEQIHVIVNVGDDTEVWGLHVSPDIDTVLYALSGRLDTTRGWGLRDETFRCLQEIERYGLPTWFQLGDADLATHVARTEMLRRMSLGDVTARLAQSMGVGATVIPATNDRLRTRIDTPGGMLDFQEFFVRERARPEVRSVQYAGATEAQAPGTVLHSIREARLVVIAPSNPITSIGAILAVPGIRDALRCTRAEVVAISPIIGDKAVSGPAGKLMEASGFDVSAGGIARCYHDLLDNLIVDTSDAASAPEIRLDTIGVQVTNILMSGREDARRLAQFVVDENSTAPVKDFGVAKQRLADTLAPEKRAALARAMLSDVLTAVSLARLPQRVVVFTASEAVAEVVRPFEFDLVEETVVRGHSAAVNQMVQELARVSTHILSLAGDLPTITPEDVDLVFDSATSEVNLVASRDGTGTNAALFVSPARIRMEYGEGSLKRHLSNASAAGYPAAVLRIPGIEFDVDTPEDLALFRQLRPARTFTWKWVAGLQE